MAYIYLHRRNDTGEVFYVGKGSGRRAWKTADRNQHWHNVVNKTGHSVEIIAKGLTDDEAFWVEPLLIEAHGGVENLTNMSDGGEGFSSEEAAALSRRNWQDPAVREKMSKARKEMWKDPAAREKHSKVMKEALQDPAERERKSKASKEMWKDPAYREKMSKARKEMWQDPVHREKMRERKSKASKEMWQDPAYREKISTTRKEMWQDPEFREMRSQQMLEQWQDPAHREKVSKSNRRKIECDKCGRMIGICVLPQHQRGPRCK